MRFPGQRLVDEHPLPPELQFGVDVQNYLKTATHPSPPTPDFSVVLSATFDQEHIERLAPVHWLHGRRPARAIRVGQVLPSPADENGKELLYMAIDTDELRTTYGAVLSRRGKTRRVKQLVVPLVSAPEMFSGDTDHIRARPSEYVDRVKRAGRWLLGVAVPHDGILTDASATDLGYVHELLTWSEQSPEKQSQ